MFKISKRWLTIIIIFIFMIIFISNIFILLKYFNIQKKQVDSSFVLETINTEPINTIVADKIVKSQYKSNSWRIKISKINLDAPILEGTEKETLRRAVGHFINTPLLNGNVCLAAHNRGYKYNYFQDIKKLEIGDVITYQTQYGEKNYKIVSNEIIEETDWLAIKNTEENKLTLITCEENKREYRRCVQAKEI